MATNVKGPFLMSRAALPAMRRAGGGSIINVGSVLGIVAIRDRAAYCASKGEYPCSQRAMALDHAQDNLRLTLRCPSIVESDMTRNLFAEHEIRPASKRKPSGLVSHWALRKACRHRRPDGLPCVRRNLVDDRNCDPRGRGSYHAY